MNNVRIVIEARMLVQLVSDGRIERQLDLVQSYRLLHAGQTEWESESERMYARPVLFLIAGLAQSPRMCGSHLAQMCTGADNYNKPIVYSTCERMRMYSDILPQLIAMMVPVVETQDQRRIDNLCENQISSMYGEAIQSWPKKASRPCAWDVIRLVDEAEKEWPRLRVMNREFRTDVYYGLFCKNMKPAADTGKPKAPVKAGTELSPVKAEPLTEFQAGIVHACVLIQHLHGSSVVAADVLKECDLHTMDCSDMDPYDKQALDVIAREYQMQLTNTK